MSSDRQKPTRISREGVVLIKSFEGFRSRAVARPGGAGWVIGYGHTASAKEGLTVSEADAELLLQYDLIPVARALHQHVRVHLNQHQFDALASFAFSVGVECFLSSRVLDRVNAGAFGEAADALTQEPDLERAPSPPRRRTAERALFVAEPGAPVTLSDLFLTALPFPAQEDGLAVNDASGELARTADVLPFPFSGQEPEAEVQTTPAAPSSEHAEQKPSAAVAFHSPYATTTGPLPGMSPQPGEVDEPTALVSESPTTETAITAAVVEPINDTAIALQPSPELTGELQPLAGAGSAADASASGIIEDAPPPLQPAPPAERAKHGKRRSDSGKFDWNETGAFLIMGGIGLVAFGAAAAAFRRAGATSSREAFVIGSVLAVIALVCIVTSSFSLYRKWTTPAAR